MAKGRDTWDYLVYYLQFFDSNPPLSQVQLFRAPLTPLVVGLPMDLGGSVLLEIVFGVLFAVSVLAWSATALTFGRVPALASAVLLLVYPAWATLYHQASSDAVFATGLSLWALVVARTLQRPTHSRVRRPRRGHRGARADPAGEPGAAPGDRGPAARGRALASPPHLGRGVPRRGGPAARGLGGAQRDPLRRLHRHPRRARLGAVPARVAGRQHDLAGERPCVAAARAVWSRTTC